MLLQALRLEIQSNQAVPAAVSSAEFTLLQQKLQFAQERLQIVEAHAKTQMETAQGLTLTAQNEVLRLQVQPHVQSCMHPMMLIPRPNYPLQMFL
jgi:hypothetical protein